MLQRETNQRSREVVLAKSKCWVSETNREASTGLDNIAHCERKYVDVGSGGH